MNRLLNMFGLCRRAGRLLIGRDAVVGAVRTGKVKTVYLTSDAAASHTRELSAVAPDVKILTLPVTMDEMGVSLGKRSCIFAATDENLAAAIEKLI